MIIRNEHNGIEFKCQKCGVEYIAEDGEYYMDKSSSTSLTFPLKYKVYCNCPHCYRMNSVDRYVNEQYAFGGDASVTTATLTGA